MSFTQAEYVIPTSPSPLVIQEASAPQELSGSIAGNFLPLSGGTMYGDIAVDKDSAYFFGALTLAWNTVYTDDVLLRRIFSLPNDGHIVVGEDIDPDVGNSEDLGDSTLYWRNIFGRDIYTDLFLANTGVGIKSDDLDARNAGTSDLGNSTDFWGDLYVTDAFIATITDIDGSEIVFKDTVVPNSGTGFDLGTSTLTWDRIFGTDILVDIVQSETSQAFVKITDDWLPTTDDTHDTGSTTFYWAIGHITAVRTNTLQAKAGNSIGTDTLIGNTVGQEDIGDTVNFFVNGYFTNIFADAIESEVSQDNVVFADDIDPSGAGTKDLGDSTNYWANGYISSVFANVIFSRSGSEVSFQDDIDMGIRYIAFTEMTAPSGATNKARLYAVVNGSSKTDLRVIFQSGASVLIATEP